MAPDARFVVRISVRLTRFLRIIVLFELTGFQFWTEVSRYLRTEAIQG